MREDVSILVVDDFSTMRRIIKKILTGLNLSRITEADNGQKAWEIISNNPVDLVICDWNMPGMTGMELMRKVRSEEKFARMPFIMVTAEGKEKVAIEKGEEDYTCYIGKPFKAPDLESKIKTMLEGR